MAVYDGGVALVRARADGSRLSSDIAKHMNSPALKSAALSAGKVVGVALAAGLIAEFGKRFVDLAADEVEAVNKVNEVFGVHAEAVKEFGETSAKSFGISKTAALQAAGAFGLIFDAAGLAEDQTAKMSTELVALAADIASFNNIDPTEALDKLASGLAGQARPLREVGVFISAARVEQEAYTLGIAKMGEELTDAQKIQARYSIILKDTTKAQGDFQRTLGVSLPNQLRVLKAELEDVGAQLGQALLPIVLSVTKALVKLAPLLVTVVPLVVKLGAAFLAWKALKFVPELLLGIASGLEAIGAAGLANKVLSIGASLSSLLGTLAAAAPLAIGFATAFVGLTAALANWDPLGIVNQESLNKQLEDGTLIVGKFRSGVIGLGPAAHAGIGPIQTGLNYAADAMTNLREAAAKVPETIERVGRAGHHFSQEFRQAVAETTRVTVGQFKNMGEAFQTTPRQLKNALNAAVNVARQYQRDIKAIMSDKSLTDEQKKALLQLEPEYRRAFVKAGDGAKQELARKAVELKRLNSQKFGEMVREGTEKLGSGGQRQGAAYMRGLSLGISASAGVARDAAARVAHQILEDVNGVLGISSPSKEGAKQGGFYIEGLIKGMNDRLRALARVAQRVGDVLADALSEGVIKGVEKAQVEQARALEKLVAAAQRKLDRLVDKMRSFKQDIRSGFDEFADLAGAIGGLFGQTDEEGNPIAVTAGDIAGTIQQQVSQAQDLARLLQEAAAKGLSQSLLSQFAGQGADAIPSLQALLANPELIAQLNAASAAIAQAAGQTANTLGEKFFGKAIRKAAEDVKSLSQALREFIRGLARMFAGTPLGATLHNLLQNTQTGGIGGTGGGGGGRGNAPPPWQTPPIIPLPTTEIHIHGNIVNEDDWWAKVDEGLAKRRRRNGRLALEGV